MIIWVLTLGSWLFACTQLASSLELRIEPRNQHIKASVATNVTVVCYADEPLSGCQFKVFENRYKRELPIFDLTGENVTQQEIAAMIPKLFGRVSGYEYVGSGLSHGQCGININVTSAGGDKNWIVGCRVRSSKGGAWHLAEMSVYGNDLKTFNVTRPPNTNVVLPGETVELLFKGEELLTYCHFQLPISSLDVNFDKGLDSAATSLYHYHGESLAAGECGIAMHRVTEQRNGWLQIIYRTKTDTLEWINTAIVVAKPPSAVELELQTTNMTANSTLLIATCTARNSRPVSRISWFIGNKLVRQDLMDDDPDDDWRWSHQLRSITQVLRWNISKDDHKKELKCLVEHISLNYAMLIRKTIKIACPAEVKEDSNFGCGQKAPFICKKNLVPDVNKKEGHTPASTEIPTFTTNHDAYHSFTTLETTTERSDDVEDVGGDRLDGFTTVANDTDGNNIPDNGSGADRPTYIGWYTKVRVTESLSDLNLSSNPGMFTRAVDEAMESTVETTTFGGYTSDLEDTLETNTNDIETNGKELNIIDEVPAE